MIASKSPRSCRLGLGGAAVLAAFACGAFEWPAFAGDSAAAAEVLFGEGKRLAQDGNFAAACPKFEESQKLDPGTGTLYRLADCYAHIGRTASAWAGFLEVAAAAKTAGQQARYDDAKRRADELERTLPKLVIHVTGASDAPDLVVKRGEVAVGPAQWDTPLPVDPGEVAVEASASGRKTWHGVVTAKAGASVEIRVPALEREVAGGAEPVSPPSRAADGAPRDPSSFGTQRTLAVVTGVLGVAGLALGGAFGLVSKSKKSDADQHCDATNTCDDEGLTLRHDAISAGNLSTIGFVAGGVLAAAGVVLWVTAPPRSPRTSAKISTPLRAAVLPRWGGLTLRMEIP